MAFGIFYSIFSAVVVRVLLSFSLSHMCAYVNCLSCRLLPEIWKHLNRRRWLNESGESFRNFGAHFTKRQTREHRLHEWSWFLVNMLHAHCTHTSKTSHICRMRTILQSAYVINNADDRDRQTEWGDYNIQHAYASSASVLSPFFRPWDELRSSKATWYLELFILNMKVVHVPKMPEMRKARYSTIDRYQISHDYARNANSIL